MRIVKGAANSKIECYLCKLGYYEFSRASQLRPNEVLLY